MLTNQEKFYRLSLDFFMNSQVQSVEFKKAKAWEAYGSNRGSR